MTNKNQMKMTELHKLVLVKRTNHNWNKMRKVKMISYTMDMAIGLDSSLSIQLDYNMAKMHPGISWQDWPSIRTMIISEWETEHWLFGKDKDTIISLPVINPPTNLIWHQISTIRLILKDYGHISTTLTVSPIKRL